MARRRKKRFGAVTGRRRTGQPGKRSFSISVDVLRYPGLLHGGNTYKALACPKGQRRRGSTAKRCGRGTSYSATAAVTKALKQLANKLK